MPSTAEDIDITQALRRCRDLLATAYSQAKNDRHRVDLGELESQAVECAAIVNASTAVQTLRVAQYAATERAADTDGTDVEIDRGIGYVEEFTDTDLAPAMCWTNGRPPHGSATRSMRSPWRRLCWT